ncbi:MAG: hypothetical protein OXH08_09550 [Gammaproteobacteria bacterium]|nr:hypothetical protein [Gammaproteobacteria bacterium]MDE0650219.1 hypothetical protein [Gammaproteobacteria bacterium]
MSGTVLSTRHIRVARTARYYTLASGGEGVAEAWFALHGYRQAARRFARRFEVLDAPKRIVVVPEALSRFYVDPSPGRHGPEHRVGASWMTREDRENEIADYVAYLDALATQVAPASTPPIRRRVVLGFSQGAHTASRWVVLGHTNVHELVLWGAGLATDLAPDALAAGLEAVHVTFVRGARDKFRDRREEEAQDAMLKELGVSFRVLVHAGEHEIAPEPLLAVAEADVPDG